MILFFTAFFTNFAIASDRSEFQEGLARLSSQTQTQPLNCEVLEGNGVHADRISISLDFNVTFKDAFVINFKMQDSSSLISTLIAYEGAVPGFPMGKLIVAIEGDTRTYRHISNGVVKDITLLVVKPNETVLEYRKLDFQSAPIIDLRCASM